MAEEKKPRIDLKARLGKKTVSAPGGSAIPPPVGLPRPTGVPAPPFGQSQAPAKPKVDTSSPYAATISAEAAPKREQAIKVEMSQEVVEAQKKGRTKIIALAGITALVGGLIGYALGSSIENQKGQDKAIEGAQDLIKEVDTANAKIEELAETLKQAREKLGSSKYPAAEVEKLGSLEIPFTGANLTGKGIGRFNPQIVNMLITFASGSEEANDQSSKIRNLLGGAKKDIEDLLQQSENPKVRWSVYFENGPYGPWVSMQPLSDKSFQVKPTEKEAEKLKKESKQFTWPKQFEIKQNGKDFKLDRYTSGDPTRAKGDPNLVPVNPDTQNLVCPSDMTIRLSRELRAMEEVLRGDKSVPGQEKDGLIDTGRALLEQLKGIGKPG